MWHREFSRRTVYGAGGASAASRAHTSFIDSRRTASGSTLPRVVGDWVEVDSTRSAQLSQYEVDSRSPVAALTNVQGRMGPFEADDARQQLVWVRDGIKRSSRMLAPTVDEAAVEAAPCAVAFIGARSRWPADLARRKLRGWDSLAGLARPELPTVETRQCPDKSPAQESQCPARQLQRPPEVVECQCPARQLQRLESNRRVPVGWGRRNLRIGGIQKGQNCGILDRHFFITCHERRRSCPIPQAVARAL